jgi:hypothetical protein
LASKDLAKSIFDIIPVIIRQKMVYPKGFRDDGYPLCPGEFAMKPKGIEYKQKRTNYACFKVCKKSPQPYCSHVTIQKSKAASVVIAYILYRWLPKIRAGRTAQHDLQKAKAV